MALDSRQKRAAVIGVGRAWYRNPHPSSMDASQRASVGQVYPVASFAEALPIVEVEEVGGGQSTAARRRRRREVEIPTAAEVFKEKILALREPPPPPLEGLDEPVISPNALPLTSFLSPVDRELAKRMRLVEIREEQAERKALVAEHERQELERLRGIREEESELLLLYLATL